MPLASSLVASLRWSSLHFRNAPSRAHPEAAVVLAHANSRADPLAPLAGWRNLPRHHWVASSELHGGSRPSSDAL
eukprot:4725223-Alexandrium_andersonii.AAC.1